MSLFSELETDNTTFQIYTHPDISGSVQATIDTSRNQLLVGARYASRGIQIIMSFILDTNDILTGFTSYPYFIQFISFLLDI
jgi:hypothetical protein